MVANEAVYPIKSFALSAAVARFYRVMRAVVLLALCSCSGVPVGTAAAAVTAPAAKAKLLEMFAIPDETMEFQATLRGMHVAGVQTAIGKAGWVDGHNAIIIRSRGKTEGIVALLGDIVWELTTTIDLDHSVAIDDHEEAWAELAGEKEHDNTKHAWTDGDQRQDVHSAVVALRGWRGAPGERTEMTVAVGGGHFPVVLVNAARERVLDKPAVRYDGTALDRFHFSFWISDDLARVPLKFRTESVLGEIGIDLVDYQVPRDH
jgi:hypothetical protein